MPRFRIGEKKRETTSFSADPDVLAEARRKAGRTGLSAFIEDFLKQWIEGKIEPSPTATTTGGTA